MNATSKVLVPATAALLIALVGCSAPAAPHQEPAPVATNDAKPTSAPADEAPAAAAGTRENPIPVDTVTEFDPASMWRFSIGATNPDATAGLIADYYMPEPASGNVYISAPMYVKAKEDNAYPDGADPYGSFDVKYVSAQGNTYTSATCVTTGDLLSVGTMYPGAEARPTVCVEIPADAVSGGAWRVGSLVKTDKFIFLDGAN